MDPAHKPGTELKSSKAHKQLPFTTFGWLPAAAFPFCRIHTTIELHFWVRLFSPVHLNPIICWAMVAKASFELP